jgi:hypothetical protein
VRVSLVIAILQVFACLPAIAQESPVGLNAWSHVQQLPVHSKVRIKSDQKTVACLVDSVNEEQLMCSHSQAANAEHYEFRRAEIRTIKLSRRFHSALLGLALGAGVGAGAGAGIGTAINSSDKGSYLHTSGGKSAGAGAAVGVIIGGSLGALVGYTEDFFAGPLVYRR